MPGSPNRPYELRDGLLSEWSEFCDRFGAREAKHARVDASGGSLSPDWLAGDAVDAPVGSVLRVTLDRFPALADAAAKARRPAVWCLYRVEVVPVRHKGDGHLVGEARVPVPLSVGAARPETVTQFPPDGLAVRTPLWLWCRGWDDALPESHKWGTAVSTAAWIVQVSQRLRLPGAFQSA